ncbi:hypothetical protein O3P69_000660 [Scylla paramamosain]|uniref:Peptidase S1 domain-containing protein n=1 Tax=Scylla paramamosain TaxID=85552 RepID=A0AAW0USE6_SCYPA
MKTLVLCLLVAGALGSSVDRKLRKDSFRISLDSRTYPLDLNSISVERPSTMSTGLYVQDTASREKTNNAYYLQVVADDHILYHNEGHEQKTVLSKNIKHEDYNSFTISNDVSVLKLSKPLTFNYRAGAQSQRKVKVQTTCITLTFLPSPTLSVTKIMARARSKTISQSICDGLPEGGKNACQAAPSRKPTFHRGLNKIVGGQEATPGQFPYQLSFQDTSYGFDFHFCGASIYNEHWAVCAGHCVQGEDMNNPNYLQVVAGDHTLYHDEGHEQTVVLSKIIQHEDYNSFTISNDVSVLKLSKPLTFNDRVKSIPLQSEKEFLGECVVSGWGTTTEGGQSPDNLHYVDVPTVTDAECRKHYGNSDIEDSMICAGLPEGGKRRLPRRLWWTFGM